MSYSPSENQKRRIGHIKQIAHNYGTGGRIERITVYSDLDESYIDLADSLGMGGDAAFDLLIIGSIDAAEGIPTSGLTVAIGGMPGMVWAFARHMFRDRP